MAHWKILPLLFVAGIQTVFGGDPVSLRLVCFDEATPLSALVAGSEKGEKINVTISSNSFSAPILWEDGLKTISFYSAKDSLFVATATLPAKIKSAILVLSPSPKDQNTSPWKITVIDDSPKNFEDGGALVANFFTNDVRFIIGDETLTLKPGESRNIPKPKVRDDFNMALVASQFQKGEAWVNTSENMLRFLPGSRYVIMAYSDPNSANPRILSMQDNKPSPPAKR